MSVENVLNSVMLQIGLDDATAQINSSTYQMRQILGFMNDAGHDISERAEWSKLHAEFDVTSALSAVTLPADFSRMTEAGAVRVDDSGFTPIRVVLSPEQWAFLTATPSTQRYCHLSGGQLQFAPALTSDGAKVRYISKNWVQTKALIDSNSDEVNIPERLLVSGTVWRWKRQKGLPYDDNLAEFEADLASDIKSDRGVQ